MNHYQILDLHSPLSGSSSLDSLALKRAYHNALLKHHPDKSLPSSPSAPSVDAIKLAFAVLSDPVTRASYDKEFLVKRPIENKIMDGFRTGEEIVDLDDLEYDEIQEKWFRGCRCGEPRGYTITEDQLEREEINGNREVLVGCTGCSLWLRVGFSIAHEVEEPGK